MAWDGGEQEATSSFLPIRLRRTGNSFSSLAGGEFYVTLSVVEVWAFAATGGHRAVRFSCPADKLPLPSLTLTCLWQAAGA